MINIDNEIKTALLNKENIKVEVFRALKNEILKFKTQKNAPEYSDLIEIQLLSKMAKAHEESIEAYCKANRGDLAASEKAEVEIIYSLLPKPVDEETVINTLQQFMKDNNIETLTKKDMGNTIKYLKSKFPVNDGKQLSEIVKGCIL